MGTRRNGQAGQKKFVLAHHKSPGDIVCMTPLVRDIKLTFGDEILIDVDTTCKDLWRHNPHLTKLWDTQRKRTTQQGVKFIKLSYGGGIRQQNHETVHFASYFHRDFKKQTGIDVPMLYPYGDLHLSEKERNASPVEGRYWVVISGGKSDFPIKVWRTCYFQEIVDWLGNQGLGAVQIGSTDKGNWHPHLDGTLNLVGKTNLRDMIRLIYHSDGVICGVTGAMHMAAALQKPCVCIAGGREAWWWEAYVPENRGFGTRLKENIRVPHRFLHTIGLLSCCSRHGCWRNKLPNYTSKDKLICKKPVYNEDMVIAECMNMITPDIVKNAVWSYYADGTIPPPEIHQESAS